MTIRVSFDGWVNEVKSFDWGHVLKMTHDRRAQNQAGEWETVGKDYIDVIVDDAQLAQIHNEKLIHVEGGQKELRAYTKASGELGTGQTIKAFEVAPLRRDSVAQVKSTVPDAWTPIEPEDAPF